MVSLINAGNIISNVTLIIKCDTELLSLDTVSLICAANFPRPGPLYDQFWPRPLLPKLYYVYVCDSVGYVLLKLYIYIFTSNEWCTVLCTQSNRQFLCKSSDLED